MKENSNWHIWEAKLGVTGSFKDDEIFNIRQRSSLKRCLKRNGDTIFLPMNLSKYLQSCYKH